MNPRRRSLTCCLAVALSTSPMVAPSAAADASAEQIVGGIEAVVFVCTPIDPKSVKPGLEMLQRAADQRKLDLVAIRKTDGYRGTYNSEVNRLLSLAPKERTSACQNAW